MKIQTLYAEVVAAGDMESMSQAEQYLRGDTKWGLGGLVDSKWGFMPSGHGIAAIFERSG